MTLTIDELLKMFPEYKPTLYYSSMENEYITPVFSHWDRIELEERLMSAHEIKERAEKIYNDKMESHNKNNIQGVLFL